MPEFAEVNVQIQYLRERCIGWPIRSYGYEGWSHFRNLPEEGRDERLDAFFADSRIENVTQRGKHVLIHTTNGLMASHLMFKGRWSVAAEPFISNYKQHRKPPTEKSNNFWIESDDGKRLNFHEPEYKGRITLFPGAKSAADVEHLAKLGPEVMALPETDPAFASNPWTLALFEAKAARSSQAIKAFLLDQKKQAGIGNIYACESLYNAEIDPGRPAKSLSPDERARLFAAIQDILQRVIDNDLDYEGIVNIYRKDSDPNGETVEKTKIAGRDTFWVPAVQK